MCEVGHTVIVWGKACGHQIAPDAAEMVERCGAETTIPECRERLVRSRCDSRKVDTVVTRTERR